MSKKSFLHSNVRGFTLIELLTVIAIIGILAAILIPVIGRVRESARDSVCRSNLRQIHTAMVLWANDHDDRLIPIQREPASAPGTNRHYWTQVLPDEGYVPPTRIDGVLDFNHVFFCPSADPVNEGTFATDFSMNEDIGYRSGGGAQRNLSMSDVSSHAIVGEVRSIAFFTRVRLRDDARFRHGGNGNQGTGNFVFGNGSVQSFHYAQREDLWEDYCRWVN